MRWIAVLALSLAAGVGGCVSVEEYDENVTSSRHIVYRRPPTTNRTRPDARVYREPAAPLKRAPMAHPAWMPACGRISPRWTNIIIHHSATANGGAQAFDRNHRERGWDELGYHFVIGNGTYSPDGYVEVGSRWHKQKHGAHCKTPNNYFNEHGIGVCLVGDFNRTGPSPKQQESLKQLLHFLTVACGISTDQITTHHIINPKTECPGRHFSLANVRRSLETPITATSMR